MPKGLQPEDQALPRAERPNNGMTKVEPIPIEKVPEPPLMETPELTHPVVEAPTPPTTPPEVTRLARRPTHVINAIIGHQEIFLQKQLEETQTKIKAA